MRASHRQPSTRAGASLVLTAVLLPVLIGLLAVSIDVAVLATARAHLKTQADAAALAGAMQLADENRVRGATDLSPEIKNAMTRATVTAQTNRVLGQNAVVVDNSANSATGDIVVGYFNPKTHLWTPPPLADITTTNAVQASATRDANHGGVVPNFFARIFGYSGTNMTVQSIAVVQNYTIDGEKPGDVRLLPIVLDQTTYKAMVVLRNTSDQYTYNPTSGLVSDGPDGVPESLLYPVDAGLPGNWGTINIGVDNNSTATISNQIQYGITPGQMATYPNSTIRLDPTLSPPSITFSGNPGISAGIESALEAIIGKPVTLPIYDRSGDNGNNAWYRVVAFAGVRIMAVSFQGNPKYVIVQPALIQDSSAIAGTPQPSWTAGGVVRLNLAQ